MKKNKLKKVRAYTLLEMMVVLGITALVLSFGTVGVVNLRKSLELRNGYSDLISNIKLIQNKARNSIIDTTGQVPKYYALYFTNNNYSSETCNINGLNLACSVTKSNIKAERFSSVYVTSNCPTIGFEKLSANIVSIQNNFTVSETGTCVIQIKHKDLNKTLSVTIDIATNRIKYE